MPGSRAKFGKQSITTAAVTAFAAELRREAAKVQNPDPGNRDHDPFVKPYAPSDDAARQLVLRKRRELVEALGPNATDDQIAAARDQGPAAALREMKWLVKQRQRRFQDDLADERNRLKRHANRQDRAKKERDRSRRHLKPGQRLDMVLAEFALVANGHTASLSEKVSTGKSSSGDGVPRAHDPTAAAMRVAMNAIEKIEDMLEAAKHPGRASSP